MNYEVVVFILIALFWIVRAIFRFFKWAGRQITGGAAGANLVRQGAPPLQAPPPSQTLPTRAPALAPPRPMPRQPQSGGPTVPREATERDFGRQEEELIAWESAALGSPLQSPAPAAAPMKKLFGSSDDLVRAIILREALGPPLSRGRSPGAPRPSSPP